jgi:hypothetical protein
MLHAAIDIHKHAFQAAVLDPESGEVVEERFSADRESLSRRGSQPIERVSLAGPSSGGAGSRRWRSRPRPAGAGSGGSWPRAVSTFVSPSQCRRAVS